MNAAPLELTALFLEKLDEAFARRPDASKPWLHPEVLMSILTDGGGGWGKTPVKVILPLLVVYYQPKGVLRSAPSNKPTRLIGGKTMHS